MRIVSKIDGHATIIGQNELILLKVFRHIMDTVLKRAAPFAKAQ